MNQTPEVFLSVCPCQPSAQAFRRSVGLLHIRAGTQTGRWGRTCHDLGTGAKPPTQKTTGPNPHPKTQALEARTKNPTSETPDPNPWGGWVGLGRVGWGEEG